MKLSTKSRYGTRILLELAKSRDQGPIRVSRIAEIQKIPVKYLEQLILTLRKAGFVESIRGPKGGHRLAIHPNDINLGQVVKLFEGQTDLVECISSPDKCEMVNECLVRDAWQEATRVLYDKLKDIKISDLLNTDGNKPNIAACSAPEDDIE